jgi:hypothetical protein
MKKNKITAAAFDAAFGTESEKVADAIWGAKAIGKAINRSPDFVRDTLVKLPGTPVRRMGREYYAIADELRDFMRPARSTPNEPARS